MPYLGKVVPIANTADIADSAVTSAKVLDGTLVDADVNASAAIAKTKLASLNVLDADVNASAAIDATKIADGSVSSTEFQYINSLSSNAQTQISATVGVANAALPKAGGTMSGTLACADELITRPELKDYSETKTALSPAATVTLDITNGNVFTLTVDQNTELAFSNPSPTGKSCAFTFIFTQDSSPRTITWPTSVDWAGGTAPTLSTASGKIDVFTFFTLDAGTIWYGFTAGQDMLTPS